MLIRKKAASTPDSSEITPESVFVQRRSIVKAMGLAGLALPSTSAIGKMVDPASEDGSRPAWLRNQVASRVDGKPDAVEPPAPYDTVTSYNNFYEFGTAKDDPAEYARAFKPHPWTVSIEGEVERPGEYHLEDLLKPHLLEERIYRFRCVEAWSMVVPWVGFSLADLIKQFNPTSKAKFVVFETLYDPEQMPGQKNRFSGIQWPYVEGLRMDEAMNPLAMMVVGLYGRTLPNQNGAPLRLMVPWKYGFKSIKSIVKIRFTDTMPVTTWNQIAPSEYGFYANVNPDVAHPRWSQARERRLPNSLFDPNWKPTLMFNGYEEEVASLYKGMNLRKHY